MDKYRCKKCGSGQIFYNIELLWNHNRRVKADPLTKLMIKVSCKDCKSYIKFAQFNEELIKFLNRQLSSIKIPSVPLIAPDEDSPIFAVKGGQAEK
jgi:hypothetical protein